MDVNPQNGRSVQRLTNKEILILQLLTQGFSNMAIADRLHLSHKTISGHKINILRKLGVSWPILPER
ncbi:response regulator transcription factor [Pseudomonas fluorescens]|uniref:HTH luxR-type domain-containing protein n=1 Tax=Pseudomonas fluorescens TaxID=294 RepID=A0A5E7SFJ1_PSEFL|nr:LuxR C-terminal-related transcriptional regulator [Pseudomonas fluorescens]VVP84814.1 hypothetical protein PS941_01095 [Pseudomonas fluorescens]